MALPALQFEEHWYLDTTRYRLAIVTLQFPYSLLATVIAEKNRIEDPSSPYIKMIDYDEAEFKKKLNTVKYF